MALRGGKRRGWRREIAALIAGLLLGSAWQAAHAAAIGGGGHADAPAIRRAGDGGPRPMA